jgi:hypothetical protein
MSDGVHIDYKTIMDSAEVDFPAMYEVAISRILEEAGEGKGGISPTLCEKLKAKRDFGLKKYGEHSFQGNFKNAMTSPVFDHLEEEILDSINYLLHIKFQLLFSTIATSFPNTALKQLIEMYEQLKSVQRNILGQDV